jgi:hypothetical protein
MILLRPPLTPASTPPSSPFPVIIVGANGHISNNNKIKGFHHASSNKISNNNNSSIILKYLLILIIGIAISLLIINGIQVMNQHYGEDESQDYTRQYMILNNKIIKQQPLTSITTITTTNNRQQRQFIVFTSTIEIRTKELIAIRSWVTSGASDVVMFVDDVKSSQLAVNHDIALHQVIQASRNKSTLIPPRSTIIHVLENPPPLSPQGKVRLSRIIRGAENISYHVPESWLVYVNADIVLSRRVYTILQTIPPQYGATSMRMNCHLMNRAVFENITTLAQLEQHCRGCEIHSSGGMDWMLFPNGFWEKRAKEHDLDFDSMLDFFLGVDFWDNSLLSVARLHLIDVSPVFLAGHLAMPANRDLEAPTRGRQTKFNITSMKASGIMLDVAHNSIRRCQNAGQKGGEHNRCHTNGGGIDGLTKIMCPSKEIGSFAVKYNYSVTVSYMKNWTRHNKWSSSTSWFLDSGGIAQRLGCGLSSTHKLFGNDSTVLWHQDFVLRN